MLLYTRVLESRTVLSSRSKVSLPFVCYLHGDQSLPLDMGVCLDDAEDVEIDRIRAP